MKRPSRGTLFLWAAAGILLLTGATVAGGPQAVPGSVFEDAESSAETAAPQSASTHISEIGRDLNTPLADRARSLLGLFVLGFIACLLSNDRKAIPWRVVSWGAVLQLLFAVFILKTPVGGLVFDGLNTAVMALLGFTLDGASFIFGNLVWDSVPVGTGPTGPGAQGVFQPSAGQQVANTRALIAFNVLPTIIFFSSLMTVLYHLRIMQVAVKGFAWIMQCTMRTSGAETLSAAGNIFVGMTEAPLLIKPFVERMTLSEIMSVMTGGFATVAGGVLAVYVGMLVAFFPDIAGHLMAASVMSAPSALMVAKLMHPESEEPETSGTLELNVDRPDPNVIGAAARGASEGLYLALNVGAIAAFMTATVAGMLL